MFFAQRPSQQAIAAFLQDSQQLSLSYQRGILEKLSTEYDLDEVAVRIGSGYADFERARAALMEWKHFDIGWADLFPRDAPMTPGSIVAVQVRNLGFWSLNGCRIVYVLDDGNARFGFAYGTLTNHAEAGEELFEVYFDPNNNAVIYRIRAVSRPRAMLARIGRPFVRALQQRFRTDSAVALKRAMTENGAADGVIP